MRYVGGFSDSRRVRSSGGSSRSLKACWWCADVKGMSFAYCVDIFTNSESLECCK